jgi:hypothetical protein
VAAIVASSGANASNLVVLASTIVPPLVFAWVCWVFFRAARRNDEQEAAEKQAAARRPHS